MAGTQIDLSGNVLGQVHQHDLSSTQNECSVIDGKQQLPIGTRWILVQCANIARIGVGAQYPNKTIDDTLENTDTYTRIAANTPHAFRYSGGKLLFSSSTASATFRITPLRDRPPVNG